MRVGEGVTTVKPGDHVLMGVLVPCGKCRMCLAGKPYQCEVSPEMRRPGGQLSDGTSRLSKDGKSIACAFAQGSFAEYVVVWEMSVAKIDEKPPSIKSAALAVVSAPDSAPSINNPKLRVEARRQCSSFRLRYRWNECHNGGQAGSCQAHYSCRCTR